MPLNPSARRVERPLFDPPSDVSVDNPELDILERFSGLERDPVDRPGGGRGLCCRGRLPDVCDLRADVSRDIVAL